MARTKLLNGAIVPLTPTEEALRDAEEATAPIPRRPRTLAAITADVNGLNAAQLFDVLRRLVIDHLLVDPTLLRRSGIPIDGDEVAT